MAEKAFGGDGHTHYLWQCVCARTCVSEKENKLHTVNMCSLLDTYLKLSKVKQKPKERTECRLCC